MIKLKRKQKTDIEQNIGKQKEEKEMVIAELELERANVSTAQQLSSTYGTASLAFCNCLRSSSAATGTASMGYRIYRST
jgi:hypothetical protein